MNSRIEIAYPTVLPKLYGEGMLVSGRIVAGTTDARLMRTFRDDKIRASLMRAGTRFTYIVRHCD